MVSYTCHAEANLDLRPPNTANSYLQLGYCTHQDVHRWRTSYDGFERCLAETQKYVFPNTRTNRLPSLQLTTIIATHKLGRMVIVFNICYLLAFPSSDQRLRNGTWHGGLSTLAHAMLMTLARSSNRDKPPPTLLLDEIVSLGVMARECETAPEHFRLTIPDISSPEGFAIHVKRLSDALAHRGHAIQAITVQASRDPKLLWTRLYQHASNKHNVDPSRPAFPQGSSDQMDPITRL